MQLSCLPVSLFGDICTGKMSVSDWSVAAADMALDAFDISILFLRDRTPAGLARFAKEIAAGGLPLGMICTYPDFTAPDPMRCEWELNRALSDISIAAELHAAYVRITAGQFHPGVSVERQLDSAMRAFDVCADAAARWGTRLVWENHSKPGAWDNIDFNFDRERLLLMRDRLRGNAIRMNYDTANAAALGFEPSFYLDCADMVETIHLNDLASVSPLRFSGVGDGIVPLAETLHLAKSCGFDGQVSLEEASMQGLDGVRRYVANARRLIDNAK